MNGSTELLRLAGVALGEAPTAVTDWQEAALAVCVLVVADAMGGPKVIGGEEGLAANLLRLAGIGKHEAREIARRHVESSCTTVP